MTAASLHRRPVLGAWLILPVVVAAVAFSVLLVRHVAPVVAPEPGFFREAVLDELGLPEPVRERLRENPRFVDLPHALRQRIVASQRPLIMDRLTDSLALTVAITAVSVLVTARLVHSRYRRWHHRAHGADGSP